MHSRTLHLPHVSMAAIVQTCRCSVNAASVHLLAVSRSQLLALSRRRAGNGPGRASSRATRLKNARLSGITAPSARVSHLADVPKARFGSI